MKNRSKNFLFQRIGCLVAPLAALLWANQTVAQVEETISLPSVLTMPWRSVGIDSLYYAPARPQLDAIRITESNRYTTDGQNLSDTPELQNKLTINSKKLASQIVGGTGRSLGERSNVTIEPVLCGFMDRYLALVQVYDTKTMELLGGASTSWPRQAFDNAATDNRLAGFVRTGYTQATTRALASIRQEDPAHSLHIQIQSGHTVSRKDEGSSLCLSALISQSFVKDYYVIPPFGADHLLAVKRWFAHDGKPRRATRNIIAKYVNNVPPRQLPFEVSIPWNMADGVFGKNTGVRDEDVFKVSVTANGAVQLESTGKIQNQMAAEVVTLKHEEWPQIAKVHGAWVYVDRGRGWGLQMRDRLVSSINGQWIMGHVVKFFGPEENLTSPRGFPIHEGAIIFIRQGQGLTKRGMEFRYDPKQFPAPWPPEKRPPP